MSVSQLPELIRGMELPLVATSAEGLILFLSAGAARLLGVTVTDAEGRSFTELLPQGAKDRLRLDIEQFQYTHGFARDYAFVFPGGRPGWLHVQAGSLAGREVKSGGLLCALTDVTAYKQHERELAQSENCLEAVFNTLQDAILCVDQELKIIYYNEAAEELYGLSSMNIMGATLETLEPLAELGSHFRALLETPDPSAARSVVRLKRRLAEGDALPLVAKLAKIKANREPLLVAVVHDASAERDMHQALLRVQKNQAIGTLASGIAHDFNNVFTAILSHLDLALLSDDCPESLKHNLLHAQTAGRLGAEVVNRLQSFSQQSDPQLAPLDLNRTLSEVVFMMRYSLGRRIRVLDYQPPSCPTWVRADANQLTQVMVTLCLNARDAMPAGGELRIELAPAAFETAQAIPPKKSGQFLRITVSDTGTGMSPEVMAHLFEPYFTTKVGAKGMGLGLSIAFTIVREHGGWMEVESQVGEGSRFHFYLPRLEPEHDADQNRPAETEGATENRGALEGREAILVVDDEEMVRTVLRIVLTYRGYKITEASDGQAGVALYRENPAQYDLVILDINMPELDGWQALVKIRQLNPQAQVILASGSILLDESERARREGAAALLRKPFQNEKLLRLVRDLMDRKLNATSTP